MAITSPKGSALLEALPSMGILLLMLGGILLAAYLIFAKAWIQYQSEQALYCAAQEQSALHCRVQLQAQLSGFLPWGEVSTQLRGSGNQWSAEVTWRYHDYSIHLSKGINQKAILAPRALLW